MLNSNAGRYHLEFDHHVLMMEEWHVQDSRMAVIKHPGNIKVLVICVSVADEAIPEN